MKAYYAIIITLSLWIGSCQPTSSPKKNYRPIQKVSIQINHNAPTAPLLISWTTSPDIEWVELEACQQGAQCQSITTTLSSWTLYGLNNGHVDIRIRGCKSLNTCGLWVTTSAQQKNRSKNMLLFSKEIQKNIEFKRKESASFIDLTLTLISKKFLDILPGRVFLIDAIDLASIIRSDDLGEDFSFLLTNHKSSSRNDTATRTQDPTYRNHEITQTSQENTGLGDITSQYENKSLAIPQNPSLISRASSYLVQTNTFQATAVSASAWAFAYSHSYGLGPIREWASRQFVKQQPIENKDFKEPIETFLKTWTLSILEHNFDSKVFSSDLKSLFQNLSQGPIQKAINMSLQNNSPLRVLKSEGLSDSEYHIKLIKFLQTTYEQHSNETQSSQESLENVGSFSQSLTQTLSKAIAWNDLETKNRILPKIEYQLRQSFASLIEYKRLRTINSDQKENIENIAIVGSKNITELLKTLVFDVGLMKTDHSELSFQSRHILKSSFTRFIPRVVENAVLPNKDPNHPYQIQNKLGFERKIQTLQNIQSLSNEVLRQIPQDTLANIATSFLGKKLYSLHKSLFEEKTRVIIKNIVQNAIQNAINQNQYRIKLAEDFEKSNGSPPSENSVIWTASPPNSNHKNIPSWFHSKSSWISEKTGSFVEKSIFKAVDKSVPVDRLYFLVKNKRTAPDIVKSISNNIIKSIVTVHIDPGGETHKSTQNLLNTYIWTRIYQTGMVLLKTGSLVGIATIGYLLLKEDAPDEVFTSPDTKRTFVLAQKHIQKVLNQYNQSLPSLHILTQLESIKNRLETTP